MKANVLLMVVAGALLTACSKGPTPWSVRMVRSEMQRNPEGWLLDYKSRLKWDYASGVELQAMMNTYDTYHEWKVRQYVLAYCDTMVNDDGTIKTYDPMEESLDRINSGKLFFKAYKWTRDKKYKKALQLLYNQFSHQPRTDEGGFWHKKVYPWQMWLDGLYMGAPFYAQYIDAYGPKEQWPDVINQFKVAARHTYDPVTGLYRHAWDSKKQQPWADSITGQSQHAWGRAMGWFAMSLVDALEFIPKRQAGRDSVLLILNSVVEGVKRYQDPDSGLWYQVMDRPGEEGNYLESSCSCMFVYAIYKAVRLGYIDRSYLSVAETGYQGILTHFIQENYIQNTITLTQTCAVAGLGGKNNRSGDYDYYIHEPIRTDDAKAIGPFINASLEYERLH